MIQQHYFMKQILCFIFFVSTSFLSYANPTLKKLGELSRSSDLDKEVLKIIPDLPSDWESISNSLLGPNKLFSSKFKKYSVESGPEIPESGDLARYNFQLSKDGKKAKLGDGPLSWVHISSDEQYIFHEPFTVINTQKWTPQHLEKSIGEAGYFKLIKYSPSTKKVIVAYFQCQMDCRETDKFIVWEISLED